MQSMSYAEAYAVLKAIADKFRTGGPANIDGLAEDFRTAREAYTICRERLDKIRREIEDEVHRDRGDKLTLDADPFAS